MRKKLELNAIHNLDCISGMQRIDAGTVDLVFADPPFNIGYDYDVYNDRKEREHYLDWSREWISGVHRVLKSTGTFWLAIGDEYAAELKLLSQEIGFTCRSWVIWYYTFGVNCKMKFSRSHAHLFHFVKDSANFTFNFNDPAVRVPSARQLVYADGRANPKGRLPDDTWILRPQDLPEGFSADGDTWYFPRVAGTFKERAGFHGCQMPEQLLGRIIRASSNGGEKPDLVLDPFSGSATTLVVAKKLGRRFLGFDISKEYIQQGTTRLKKTAVGAPLEGAADPQTSAPVTPAATRAKAGKSAVTAPAKRGGPKKQAAAETPAAPKARVVSAARRSRPKEAAAATVPLPTTANDAEPSARIIDAFRSCHAGYSADRVVADPALNAAFAAACSQLKLAGTVKEWNLALLALRKSGRLTEIGTTQQTSFDWQAADRFLFASEIALAQIESTAVGLDQALCDPELATRFDRLAASFAPGHSPFDYRWGALRIRKESSEARRRAQEINLPELSERFRLGERPPQSLAGLPGMYLLSSSPSRTGALLAGETLDLGTFCASILSGDVPREAWRAFASKLFLWFAPLERAVADSPKQRFARIARLVAEYEPRLNYRPTIVRREAVA